ncbi:hypothetical protein BKA57DRAFT_458042 [Linnemannia elongata]|nr:hypothetical protein BKA57DRAFT_458042 [Linnemannia elongata]
MPFSTSYGSSPSLAFLQAVTRQLAYPSRKSLFFFLFTLVHFHVSHTLVDLSHLVSSLLLLLHPNRLVFFCYLCVHPDLDQSRSLLIIVPFIGCTVCWFCFRTLCLFMLM